MDSIFGIGIFEFIFILIFALIFLGPERLPKVTKDVLDFIRRLQRLSGDLTRQVNEEIGDLRELDPRYHMDQMMKDEEDEQEKQTASQEKEPAPPVQTSAPQLIEKADTLGRWGPAPSSTVQTSAPSQPQPAKATNAAVAGQNSTPKAETISSTPTKSTGTNLSTAANGRQSSAARAKTDAGLSTTPASKPQKRGVKSLAELRKQQRAKRQPKTSGTNSSYLAERNKRAQGRAQTRREVMAAQKIEKEAVADGDESTLVDERSGPEPAEPKAVVSAGQAHKEDGDSSEETKA